MHYVSDKRIALCPTSNSPLTQSQQLHDQYMNIKTMNLQKSRGGSVLAHYISQFSLVGIDYELFVEGGGKLVSGEDSAELRSGLGKFRSKISDLRQTYPQLAARLEFLANFFALDAAIDPETVRNVPEKTCHETIFALLYAAKDIDLIPDHMPEIGYCDDSSVVETVLSRNASVFEQYCATRGLKWDALKPEPATETASDPIA